MLTVKFLLPIIGAYLIGAIPFGYIIVRLVRNKDIRQVGSGNIGATNVRRAAGTPLGILVFVLDGLKGSLATLALPVLSYFIFSQSAIDKTGWLLDGISLSALCGLSAFLGHLWPVYLRFQGGKGVAVSFGVFIVLAPYATLLALGLWCLCLILFRYVSLSSMVAGLLLPINILILDPQVWDKHLIIWLSAWLVFILMVIKHQANIKRLLKGNEPRLGKPINERRKQ